MSKDTRLDRKYEGPAVLADLLERSRCELTVEEIEFEFESAVEDGTPASEVIPLLWEQNPHFPDPAVARRTFSNLFGLYELVATAAVADLIQLEPPDPSGPLTPTYVDQTWLALEELPASEMRRARDRFDNTQADLLAVLTERLMPEGDVAVTTAMSLAFETWWILRQARGDLVPVRRADLERCLAEPDDPEHEVEPALASLVTATAWEQAAEEGAELDPATIPVLERVLRAVRRALAPS